MSDKRIIAKLLKLAEEMAHLGARVTALEDAFYIRSKKE